MPSSDNLMSRLIQAFAVLAIMWVLYMTGAQTFMGSPGMVKGDNPVGGILSYTFLHGDYQHIMANTTALAPLMLVLALAYRSPAIIIASIIVIGGIAIQMIMPQTPVAAKGASALLCGLIVFLVISGFKSGSAILIVAAVAVVFFYGATLYLAVLPGLSPEPAWAGHFGGALGGLVTALFVPVSRA